MCVNAAVCACVERAVLSSKWKGERKGGEVSGRREEGQGEGGVNEEGERTGTRRGDVYHD